MASEEDAAEIADNLFKIWLGWEHKDIDEVAAVSGAVTFAARVAGLCVSYYGGDPDDCENGLQSMIDTFTKVARDAFDQTRAKRTQH